jgi:hypothetical protein
MRAKAAFDAIALRPLFLYVIPRPLVQNVANSPNYQRLLAILALQQQGIRTIVAKGGPSLNGENSQLERS